MLGIFFRTFSYHCIFSLNINRTLSDLSHRISCQNSCLLPLFLGAYDGKPPEEMLRDPSTGCAASVMASHSCWRMALRTESSTNILKKDVSWMLWAVRIKFDPNLCFAQPFFRCQCEGDWLAGFFGVWRKQPQDWFIRASGAIHLTVRCGFCRCFVTLVAFFSRKPIGMMFWLPRIAIVTL